MTAAPRHRSLLLAVLTGLALLLQSLTPAGWMPAASAHGPALMLCDGTAPMAMAPPMPMAMPGMDRHDHGGPAKHHAPGVFGALPATPPPALAPCPLPRPVATPAQPPHGVVQLAARGLGTPPQPSTGPPLSV